MRLAVALAAGALWLTACTSEADDAGSSPAIQFQRASADAQAHGARLADVLGCTGCHGADLTGRDWSEPGFARLWTSNLTRAVRDYDDAQLAEVIRSGARPDRELWGMPSHLFTQLTADDMAAVIGFLRSRPVSGDVHPAPALEEGARRAVAAGMIASSRADVAEHGSAWPPDAGAEHALGRYIVRATCAECHGLDLRGGQPIPQATATPDLRIAAGYEPEPFRRLLRTGIAAGDRELALMGEVARGRFSHLTDAELDAVHLYLKKVAEIAP